LGEREYGSRRMRYRQAARRQSLDGLLVNDPADVLYLCGFTGSNGTVLLLPRGGYFLTDFRYREQAGREVNGLRVVVYRQGLDQALTGLLSRRPGASLGFDPSTLSHSEVLLLRRSLKGIARLTRVRKPFQALRACKSDLEVEIIRKSINLSQKAFKAALRACTGDMRERDLAVSLDFEARRMGASGPAFETIVAGGSRAAMAHAHPSGRKLRGATVIDWGIRFRGYCTDTTRTLSFGKLDSALRRAHRLVIEAQERALERIRPGIRAGEVDMAARDLIEKGGFGNHFGHSLGHGVGLEVHERPLLGPGSREVLEEGMVFTVEPGIYIPGVGGVRVEDMVLLTSGGAELLTDLSRSLDPSEY
jgi:Xaa-Pro aminopeptidase